ncbi:coiled-coil domain-containing protein 191 [Lepisosteus oculatus]|uniref:coiled-coil domain-containing protein 191 n=1 Tax=Lepisosteus oculatus TaxID=7918 RepID=UPI00371DCF0C
MCLENRRILMNNVGHNPELFRWKRLTKSKTPVQKVQLKNDDIDHWMKRVEAASEFAVSEVFSLHKPVGNSKIRGHAMALESTDQLQDHDDAFSEAQTLLSEWVNSKLRLELETEDEDGLGHVCETDRSEPAPRVQDGPDFLRYDNFDDLFSHLEQEAESSAVHSFLQDLMEKEVVESGVMDDLRMDTERKRRSDPRVTMEVRHRQVKESRARREAEQERRRRDSALQREARAAARRLLQGEERRKRLEAQRQEELIQREVVRLRKDMAEQRSVAGLARQMERERQERKRSAEGTAHAEPIAGMGVPKSSPQPMVRQAAQMQLQHEQLEAERLRRLRETEARIHILNLRRLQKHFSAWYSVVLERRLQAGKAAALCDWRSQLRAWRAWRALVWARRAERTEEELRGHNRKCQRALESDRRRLLRHFLGEWRRWCRARRERRRLQAQQEETRRKMAALISAASSGELWAGRPAGQGATASSEQHQPAAQTESTQPSAKREETDLASPPPAPAVRDGGGRPASRPKHAWQVTKKHAALTAEDLSRNAQQPPPGGAAGGGGGGFEHRHAFQQRMLEQQRRQLREQQEMILELQENQRLLMLRQEAERAQASLPAPPAQKPSSGGTALGESRSGAAVQSQGENHPKEENNTLSVSRAPLRPSCSPHPAVTAMEERAKQRAVRRKEIEEMKRKREEERIAQLQAAEEERQRQEEAERQAVAERKREERRLQRQREQERLTRLEREQQLQARASDHYLRTLLTRRGLAPWKRLLEQARRNAQLAETHHGHSLLRRCFSSWLQTAGESLAEKEARAEQLYRRILLRRCLHRWLKCKDYCSVLEEKAGRLCRARLQRKTLLALLDYCTQERMARWDREQLAERHSRRRAVVSCFRAWRGFPHLLREEREREARRERLRRRVAEVLPDFGS